MVDVRVEFGKKLREIRENQKLTQEQLADKAGMHFTYIGQIERGLRNPSLVNISKLSKALKTKSSELLPF